MKRTWLACLYSLCLCIVAATVWVLTSTSPVHAATGTADCGNGLQVTCNAANCNCEDLVGCTAFNPGGTPVFTGCVGPKISPPGDAAAALEY